MQPNFVTSASNPQLQMIRKLRDRKGRLEHRVFMVEGLRFVLETLAAEQVPSSIVLAESFAAKVPAALSKVVSSCPHVMVVPNDLFSRIADTENPQGILAVFPLPDQTDWHDVIQSNGRYILLERIQDPGNVGTIIRTADACAFDAVFLTHGCADLFSPKVLRSTMGSVWHLPVHALAEQEEQDLISTLKQQSVRVLAADPRGDETLWRTPLLCNFAVVVGNEANGLSDQMKNMVDAFVQIPMPGKSESLNAAVAAAILMTESVRQGML